MSRTSPIPATTPAAARTVAALPPRNPETANMMPAIMIRMADSFLAKLSAVWIIENE